MRVNYFNKGGSCADILWILCKDPPAKASLHLAGGFNRAA